MGTGKTYFMLSGIVTKNTIRTDYADILGYGITTIYANVTEVASGSVIGLHMDGVPVSMRAPQQGDRTYTIPLINSGDVTLNSGDAGRWTLSDPYDEVAIHTINQDSNKSGRITVTISNKRRQ